MESAVAEILDKLTNGTEEEKRKYGIVYLQINSLTMGNNKSNEGLKRALTKRSQSYEERKKSRKVMSNIKNYNQGVF